MKRDKYGLERLLNVCESGRYKFYKESEFYISELETAIEKDWGIPFAEMVNA